MTSLQAVGGETTIKVVGGKHDQESLPLSGGFGNPDQISNVTGIQVDYNYSLEIILALLICLFPTVFNC